MSDDKLAPPPSSTWRLLRAEAQAANHRLTLLISGDADWTASQARQVVTILPDPTPVWLTDRPLAARTRPLRTTTQLLGQDLSLLIYDAHGGFDPDGFGAATGAIRGGGVLILLTPPLADWPEQPDPQAERIAVWPHAADSLSGRFLARLVRVLEAAPDIVRIRPPGIIARHPPPRPDEQGDALAPPPPTLDAPTPPSQPITADQSQAVEAILATARGRARRPLVLTAHRGRGKSAALGLAAGRLLLAGDVRILITAPRRASVEPVFRHAEAVLRSVAFASLPSKTDQPPPKGIDHLAFMPPAALAADRPAADLLLVDEAAGIPAPLLETLLAQYPRVVFATTVHGYEGTGRGFETRFRATLERLTPNWRALGLDQPIRWAPGDPLEALTFQALLLDAAPSEVDQPTAATDTTGRCERLDPAALARDEATLRELFGLLVLAHYQTRPMDLRMLLDGPNVRIYVLRHEGHITAALLAAEEGGFEDAELRDAIFMGRRRPRGHLLPQTLSAHAGLMDAPAYRYLRVIRIAVHPALAQRGLGRRLLRALFREGRADGFDLAGASFGATPDLLRFWDRCGYRPVQIGTSRNAASGEHAIVMLRRLNGRGASFVATARQRLASRLPVLLAGPLRTLDPSVAVALIGALHAGSEPIASPPREFKETQQELAGFVTGHRTLDATLPLLATLTHRQLGARLRSGAIGPGDAALLIAVAGQLRPLSDVVRLFAYPGREGLVTDLRRVAGLCSPGCPQGR